MQAQVLVYVCICAIQGLECRRRYWYMYIYVPYKLWNAGAGVGICIIIYVPYKLLNAGAGVYVSIYIYIFQGRMHQLVWYAYIHRYNNTIYSVVLVKGFYMIVSFS